MSEVFDHRLFPSMARAFPTEWLTTIARNQAIPAKWVFGGHGFVDDPATMKEELEAFRVEIVAVIGEARRLHDAHVPCLSAADCQAARQADWGPYADWSEKPIQATPAILRVYQELDGKLPK
jgi:hypothetical protein